MTPDPSLAPDAPLTATDCLVVLGRGIERVGTHRGRDLWRPTRYVQQLDADGSRTGYRLRRRCPADDRAGPADAPHPPPGREPAPGPVVVVAGGHATTLAGVQFLAEAHAAGTPPPLLVLAAGRPGYLDAVPDPGLSEGAVMREVIARKAPAGAAAGVVVLAENRNTRDDVVRSLSVARERGLRAMTVVNTIAALERTKLFFRQTVHDEPDLAAGVDVRFLAAEDLLRRRYARSPTAATLFDRLMRVLLSSEAWRVTRERERGGIEALQQGTYRGSGAY